MLNEVKKMLECVNTDKYKWVTVDDSGIVDIHVDEPTYSDGMWDEFGTYKEGEMMRVGILESKEIINGEDLKFNLTWLQYADRIVNYLSSEFDESGWLVITDIGDVYYFEHEPSHNVDTTPMWVYEASNGHSYTNCKMLCTLNQKFSNWKSLKIKVSEFRKITNDGWCKQVSEFRKMTNDEDLNNTIDALETLNEAMQTIQQRGEGYDNEKERSMTKTVALFNTLTDNNITVKDGWKFMMLVKLVRSQQGIDKLDNYVDLAGYASLCSEELNNE